MTIHFLNLQITRSDIRPHIKWAVSLVIAYGHFNTPQGFVYKSITWTMVWVGELSFSSIWAAPRIYMHCERWTSSSFLVQSDWIVLPIWTAENLASQIWFTFGKLVTIGWKIYVLSDLREWFLCYHYIIASERLQNYSYGCHRAKIQIRGAAMNKYFCPCLKPQAESLLFAAVLLLLQPIQIEEVDRVLQSVGLIKWKVNTTWVIIL